MTDEASGPRLAAVQPLSDIPLMIRLIADDIEAGHYGDPECVVVVLKSKDIAEPRSFAHGYNQDRFRVAGLLMHCINRLANP